MRRPGRDAADDEARRRRERRAALVTELLASARGGVAPIGCDGTGCSSNYPCGPDQPTQET